MREGADSAEMALPAFSNSSTAATSASPTPGMVRTDEAVFSGEVGAHLVRRSLAGTYQSQRS